MWLTIKEALIALSEVHPETVIHLAGGYVHCRLSPYEADKVRSLHADQRYANDRGRA